MMKTPALIINRLLGLIKNNVRDIATVCSVAAVTMVIFHPQTAHAYIDPGSGSAIITVILGVIGAIGYTFRKYYYKIKNLFGKKSDDKDNSSS
ncbi:MAG: hypothetical protein ACNYPH_05310 [Gammaproteobacteria bacterium WSBS_2016_MAG_OTU1]